MVTLMLSEVAGATRTVTALAALEEFLEALDEAEAAGVVTVENHNLLAALSLRLRQEIE